MEDRNDIDLTTLCVDTWKHCDKCVIRNPSCDDCKLMWTAQMIDENNIQRAIHERIDLTNEDDTDDEEVEAQELADDSESDDDVKEEEPEEMEVQILGDDDQV